VRVERAKIATHSVIFSVASTPGRADRIGQRERKFWRSPSRWGRIRGGTARLL